MWFINIFNFLRVTVPWQINLAYDILFGTYFFCHKYLLTNEKLFKFFDLNLISDYFILGIKIACILKNG